MGIHAPELPRKQALEEILRKFKDDEYIGPNIAGIVERPDKEAVYVDFPTGVDDRLRAMYAELGFEKLYSHQAAAFTTAVENKKNFVIVTPTASGKSLCYQMPVLSQKLHNENSRALLLFPTKALAQDQLAGFEQIASLWEKSLGYKLKCYNFDGDTPGSVRTVIRNSGDIVLSNPDMLHSGILPHHTLWVKLFENLEYVIIDELHQYKGVFGSHLANVIRRLKRICAFYGSNPKFMCASATIKNPKEHAEALLEEPVELINESGAPQGAKTFMFYNPPLVHQGLGVRRSPLKEAVALAGPLLQNGIATIFFCRSRTRTEVLLSDLKRTYPKQASKMRAYRGGYLPSERRKIEKQLRDGELVAVVSTNALELGVDIGSLTASVSVGFPGSMNSLIQQFGRAGRRKDTSLSIMIANNSPIDQFLVSGPDEGTLSSPEEAIINPDNLLIVSDHIKCAGFELPFRVDEKLGTFEETGEVLEILAEQKVVKLTGDTYRWASDTHPANNISLRTASGQNFVINDITHTGREQIIGETDYFATPTMLHDQAIYLHQGQPYFVEKLHWDDRQADVRQVEVDYYTDATEKVEIEILEDEVIGQSGGLSYHRGEIAVKIKAVMFKKIKWETNDNVGHGYITTPEIPMHTQAVWLLLENHDLPVHALGPAINGMAYVLRQVAPYYILCDKNDINVRAEVRSQTFEYPALLCYDRTPGGILLSYKILVHLPEILEAARGRIVGCGCDNGCPACIGAPPDDEVKERKVVVFKVIDLLRAGV